MIDSYLARLSDALRKLHPEKKVLVVGFKEEHVRKNWAWLARHSRIEIWMNDESNRLLGKPVPPEAGVVVFTRLVHGRISDHLKKSAHPNTTVIDCGLPVGQIRSALCSLPRRLAKKSQTPVQTSTPRVTLHQSVQKTNTPLIRVMGQRALVPVGNPELSLMSPTKPIMVTTPPMLTVPSQSAAAPAAIVVEEKPAPNSKKFGRGELPEFIYENIRVDFADERKWHEQAVIKKEEIDRLFALAQAEGYVVKRASVYNIVHGICPTGH